MMPYIGGKKMHARWIDPLFPTGFQTYVEVFGGAMWMYWMSDKTPVQRNIYNDFNRHLYNVFTCASTDPVQFHQALKQYQPGDAQLFEQFRDQIFSMPATAWPTPDYDLAARYMYLQTQFFTGGQGLHPRVKIYHNPRYKSKYITYLEKFTQPHYLHRLSKLSTENQDCRDLIRQYDSPQTFFYIDPPYFNLEDYYTNNSFGRQDHIELLTLLTQIQGRFALSYYYFDVLEQLLPRTRYVWHEQVTYTNNGLKRVSDAVTKTGRAAKGIRPQRTEVLIMNYQPTVTVPLPLQLANPELFEFS